MPTAEELAAQAAAAIAANSDTGDAPGTETPVVPANSGEKLFTQADLDAKIDERLKRERAAAKTKAEKEKAEEDERQKTAAGEWQKLAEERKTQVEQLTAKGELADKLSEIIAKQLDTEIATWPEEAQALVLPSESPLLQRIESADRARPIVQKLMAAQGIETPAATATPGLRFPAQHPGTATAPVTTKTIAQQTLDKAYAPRTTPAT